MSQAAARSAGTEASPEGFAETVMLPRAASRCVLRVLSGDHTGAESEIVTDRVLIGNLELECDIVLDVKREERHACLVRVSDDSWTVLAIAGELWLDEAFIAPQQTCTLRSGQVLTLGRVAMCVADPDTIDWSAVRPPLQLVKPEADGPVPQTALLPSRSTVRQKWQALKLAAGLGLGALVLASASVYLSEAWLTQDVGPEATALRLQADRTRVASLPFAQEVSVLTHPESPRRLLLSGYVPTRQHVDELGTTIQQLSSPADVRVHVVDLLSEELGRRFDGMEKTRIQYVRHGRFELETELGKLPTHDRQARMTLQELPAIKGLILKTVDVRGRDGSPAMVRYERSTERPGDLIVENLDDALGRRPFKVNEVRLGALPSVVLDDGLRYFVEARLPDGSVIASIEEDRVVLRSSSGAKREMAFDGVSITHKETSRRTPGN